MYPPENLSANVNGNDVLLLWEEASLPGTLELLGYNIYRDNILVNPAIVSSLEYTDVNVPPGTYEYKINSVYIGKEGYQFITIEVFVEGSSISENIDNYFEIYPNPASDYIYVVFKNEKVDYMKCTLTELNGGEVFSYDCNPPNFGELKLELPKISNGIYLLQIETNSKIFSRKILVN